MKLKRRSNEEIEREIKKYSHSKILFRKMNFFERIVCSVRWKFLWIGRFLFTWGWNGEKNTFSVSFYDPGQEVCYWTIGDY